MAKPLALIIEDQANLAMLYEDALRLIGYDILAVNDGLKALNHLETHPAPDLVILDVNLPHMSGRDIHKHIRNSSKYSNTAVIILTANSLMIDQLRPEIRTNDYLHLKPIGMKELQELAKSLRPDADGKPSHLADTQKVPHLLPKNDPEKPISETSPSPTILSPDNVVIEPTEAPIVDPKAETQEHTMIITPNDDVIPSEDNHDDEAT